jgi:hypothetical protein
VARRNSRWHRRWMTPSTSVRAWNHAEQKKSSQMNLLVREMLMSGGEKDTALNAGASCSHQRLIVQRERAPRHDRSHPMSILSSPTIPPHSPVNPSTLSPHCFAAPYHQYSKQQFEPNAVFKSINTSALPLDPVVNLDHYSSNLIQCVSIIVN